jgi:hypothetical protein
MLMRWNDFLSQFNLEIRYVEGKDNIADALSRLRSSTTDKSRTELTEKALFEMRLSTPSAHTPARAR